MKKNQDIGKIERSPTPGGKIAAALYGKLSQMVIIIGSIREIRDAKQAIEDKGETPVDRFKAILNAPSELNAVKDAYQRIGMVVHNAIERGDHDLFRKLAEHTEFPSINDPSSSDPASPIDFAVLELQFKHRDTWPDLPMTRFELELYLADVGLSPPDGKTLSAVLKRCGIKLKKTKPGPKPERKHRQ